MMITKSHDDARVAPRFAPFAEKAFRTKPRARSIPYVGVFWLAVSAYAVIALVGIRAVSLPSIAAGAAVAFCAFLPTYLWCVGKLPGLPIFPAMAMTYCYTFALPLIVNKERVEAYDTSARVMAAFTAVLFLLTGTFVYYFLLNMRHAAPRRYLAIPTSKSTAIYVVTIALGSAFQFAVVSKSLIIPSELMGIGNAMQMTFISYCVFILSFRWGQGKLSLASRVTFTAALLLALLANLASTLMIGAMSYCVIAVAGFTMGKGKLPAKTLFLIVLCFCFLHVGKAKIRELYWGENERSMALTDYPEFYATWIAYSAGHFQEVFETDVENQKSNQDLQERASLVQMTLLVQSQSPDSVPFLMGRTLTIIPGLLLPRFLYPEKATTQEGNMVLSESYGLQTRLQMQTTMIAFGQLAESYANFGFVGVVGMAIALGAVFAFAARFSRDIPLTSFRGMVSLLMLFAAFQVEQTTAVSVTSLFQSYAVIMAASLLIMKLETRPLNGPIKLGRRA